MASRTTPMSNDWFSVLFTPISMLSKSTKTAIFSRGSVTKWSWEMGTCIALTGRVDPPPGGEHALGGTDRGAPSRASAGRWPGRTARQPQSITFVCPPRGRLRRQGPRKHREFRQRGTENTEECTWSVTLPCQCAVSGQLGHAREFLCVSVATPLCAL